MRRCAWCWAALVVLAVLATACGRAGVPPTPTPPVTASPAATATPLGSLRDVDFAGLAFAGDLIARAGGGEVSAERVRFAQLIAGGPEEAVVIVDSGGSAGEIGAAIYRLVEGRAQLVRFFSYNGRLDLIRELIVTREGVYDSGDAQCCPSRLHEVTYQWNGAEFAVTTDQIVPNPSR